MKARPVVCILVVCLLSLAPSFVMQAQAYNSRASASLSNIDTYYNSGPTSASLSQTTANGVTVASASFSTSAPDVSATANALTGYSMASAGIGDYLVFSGPTGSYTDVTMHIVGNWSVYYNWSADPMTYPRVRFSVGLSPMWADGSNTYDSWRSWYSGSIGETSDHPNMTVVGGWQQSSGDDSNASGTYAFDLTTRVYYGYDYHLTLAVIAEATGPGHRAYIDDPLTIALSDGVTFESVSGTKYAAVPVPPSLLLLAPGLVGLAAARRRFKK